MLLPMVVPRMVVPPDLVQHFDAGASGVDLGVCAADVPTDQV
jgi:hypothetical protein